MRQLLLSTAALILLAVPALAQPHSDRGDEEHSRRVGKASVAPEVQDRAQAQLRGQEQERGRGEERRGQAQLQQAQPARGNERHDENRVRGNAPAAPAQSANMENRGNRDYGDRFRGRDNRDRGRDYRFDNRNDGGRDRDRRLEEGRPDFNRDWNRDLNRDGRTGYRQPNYGGPRHDFSGFRDYHRNFHASRRFRADFYRRPAGWYEHRWVYGE